MKVTDYKIKDDKITLYLDGEEKLVGTYYFKDKNEIQDIKYGAMVEVEGKLNIPSSNTVPHTFNYKEYLKKKRINYVLSINSFKVMEEPSFIYKLKNKIKYRIDNIDSTGYMQAFILGDKSSLDDSDYANYKYIGVTHLFAISGMHIGLLSEILLKLLKKLRIGLKYLIIDAFLVLYGFIVCYPASIKRCIVFYIINSLNKVFNLVMNNKQVLLLTICFLILLDPYIIYDVGFLFSVCTVGGIILCSDYIKDDNKIKEAFKLSIVAFLFSMPINLYSFYQINLLSPLYNVIFIPFISLIVYPLSLITFVIPYFSYLFSLSIKTLEYSSSVLSNISMFNINVSFNIYEVLLFYLFLYLVFVKQHRSFICCLLLIVIIDLLVPFFDSNAHIYYLDVKQGDASILITPYRREVILIDTGGIQNYHISDNYISLLKYLGIQSIDYLILTHGDYDHMGDASYLVDNFKVGKIIFNCGEFNDLENELINVLNKKGITYYSCINQISNSIKILNTREYDNENDNSNVLYTNIYNHKLLFMGDAGIDKEKDIVNKYDLNDIDILKVGHHGSRTSSSKEFIDSINPKHSIISVGKKNRYGHPNKEVINNLKKSVVYRTDRDGTIEFKINMDSLTTKVYQP